MNDPDESEPRTKLYDILNVSTSATDSQIRDAHRRLSRLFHPDKHNDPTLRALADPKFQEIQHAFEVLSDPRQRAIYDNIGEEGLGMTQEVGRGNMTPQEMKLYWLNQARQARVDELDSLVNSRGNIGVTVDARSMFGDRVVVEQYSRPGIPVPYQVSRAATWSERFSDVMVRGINLRQSFTIPFTFSTLFKDDDGSVPQKSDHGSAVTITAHAGTNNRKQPGQFGVLANLRHRISNRTTFETSVPLLAPRVLRSKLIHQHSPELFITLDSAIGTLSHPPEVTLTTGRQITSRSVLFGTLRSGSPWKLGPWGEHGNAASYILGWTRNAIPEDKKGYSIELITGLQVLGVAGDYSADYGDIKMKLGGSITTNGIAGTIGATRQITTHTRAGIQVQSTGQLLILRLSISRLGQSIKLPLWIGDGYDPDAFVYGVLAPLVGLLAVEYFFIHPRRQNRKLLETKRRQESLTTRLRDLEVRAHESVRVMTPSILRRQELAKDRGDLYIVSAFYGASNPIDVTIALAAQVVDNQLIIPRIKFRTLLGFWDPEYGVDKELKIVYEFRGRRHEVIIPDYTAFAIPSKTHL